jgi:transposase-like protein
VWQEIGSANERWANNAWVSGIASMSAPPRNESASESVHSHLADVLWRSRTLGKWVEPTLRKRRRWWQMMTTIWRMQCECAVVLRYAHD